jgi:hypothetical protein
MPRNRCTNEQIAFALRQAENGTPVAEICRKMGVSEPSFTAGRSSSPRWGDRRSGVSSSLKMRM